MLGFGPFCLDLGHIAWIWAIWQNMGLNGQNDVPKARIGVFWQDLGHFAWILAIMLGIGQFRFDLGHID